MCQRVVRRNSILEFHESAGVVIKRYIGEYVAQEELQAYQALSEIVADVPGVRTAAAALLCHSEHQLQVEWVRAPTLHAVLRRGDRHRGQRAVSVLATVAARADGAKQVFDLDPKNVLVTDSELVLIDPVARRVPGCDLHNYSTALFGLQKCLALSGKRMFGLAGMQRVFCQAYVREFPAAAASRTASLSTYVRRVADWNSEPNGVESPLLSLARQWVISPALRVYGAAVFWLNAG